MHPFEGLNFLVQYRRKDCIGWNNMAAFDVLGAAERYHAKQDTSEACPWEYRLTDLEGSPCTTQ